MGAGVGVGWGLSEVGGGSGKGVYGHGACILHCSLLFLQLSYCTPASTFRQHRMH
jgi:hypothetical protein